MAVVTAPKGPVKAPVSQGTPQCAVEEKGGKMIVHFVIEEPATIKRLKSRMGPQDPATYLWDNILKRAIETHCW